MADDLEQLWGQLTEQEKQQYLADYEAQQAPYAQQLQQANWLRQQHGVAPETSKGAVFGGIADALRQYKANQITQDAQAHMKALQGHSDAQVGLGMEALQRRNRLQPSELAGYSPTLPGSGIPVGGDQVPMPGDEPPQANAMILDPSNRAAGLVAALRRRR